MKVKRIRNLKNFIENLLFICVVMTIGCIFSSLLYLAFKIAGAALVAARLWLFLLIADVVLFTATQFCDIAIWWIKIRRRANRNYYKRKTFLKRAIRFSRAFASYYF